MPVARGYVLVLQDGQVVIDWGEGRYQEIVRGEFLTLPESEISHVAQDTELEYPKTLGQILPSTAATSISRLCLSSTDSRAETQRAPCEKQGARCV